MADKKKEIQEAKAELKDVQKELQATKEVVEVSKDLVDTTKAAVEETTGTLIGAMESVERSLKETGRLMGDAVFKARDAETVIKLLKARVKVLAEQVSEKLGG